MAHPALALFFGLSSSNDDGWRERSRRHSSAGGGALQSAALSDDHRLARIRAGDKAVFAELYDTYFDDLEAFAYRFVRDHAGAEDVVHDVFLNIWTARATFDVRTSLRAYLFGAVANRARALVTRTRRREMILSSTADEAEGSGQTLATRTSPYETLESQETRRVVAEAVAALPERQRLAFTLRMVHDMTYEEIATVLGITKSSVAELIGKAQARLKLALGPRD